MFSYCEDMEEMVRIACDLYNQDHRGMVQPKDWHLLPPYACRFYGERAVEIMKATAKHRAAMGAEGLQTAAADQQFIKKHPVNGDIDSSPYPFTEV